MQSNEIFGGDTLDFHFQKTILQNYKNKIFPEFIKIKLSKIISFKNFVTLDFSDTLEILNSKKINTHTFFFWKLFLCVDICNKKYRLEYSLFFIYFSKNF